MVDNITNYGKNGLYEWFFQRVTAVVIGVYFVYLHCYILNAPAEYLTWYSLYCNWFFKIFSTFVFMCVIIHAWVGMWTIFTDYVTVIAARTILQIMLNTLFFVLLVVFIDSLWFINGMW